MGSWRPLGVPLKLLPCPETGAGSLLPPHFSSNQQLYCKCLERGKITRRCQKPILASGRRLPC